MSAQLPPDFLARPIAHRGLHGPDAPENSLAAVRAAVAAGYGIEIDLQPSADGVAMVFHDARLDRMTNSGGLVHERPAAALRALPLAGGPETIPTLEEVLEAVAGRVPLLLELKDQSPPDGPGIGPLEAAVAQALEGYDGPVAVMSFNPRSVAEMAARAPQVPRGLTSDAWEGPEREGLSPETLSLLRELRAFDTVGACFVSHDADDLDNPALRRLKARGVPILTWTIRSPEEEERARRVADQITFEGYRPAAA